MRFTGTLEPVRQGGAMVALPPEVVESLGGTRVRVKGTCNGVEFRSSTMPSGGGGAALGIHKATRERAGVGFHEQVEIELERDQEERPIAVPPVLQEALDGDPEASRSFQRLSPTHRREYAQWVAEAKRQDTVQRRVKATLDRLRGG